MRHPCPNSSVSKLSLTTSIDTEVLTLGKSSRGHYLR